MLAPVVLVMYLAFVDDNFVTVQPSGYSIKWFREVLSRGQMVDGLIYSTQISAVATLLSVALGLPAGISLARSRMRGRRILESMFILPVVIPAIVVGVTLYISLYQVGGTLGFQLAPSFGSLVLAHILITFPWTFRLVYAGMLSIDPKVERASIDLGANQFQTTLRVILPLLRPATIGAATLAFVFSFSNLEVSLFLVDSGNSTLPVAMTQYAKFRVDPSIAAISTIQIALAGVLLIVANRVLDFGTTFSGGSKG
ncbi:ABC transporter permease [Ornithinimicrobium cryptoxanthini]|uniref:ABC transporter permease n=1 Tax=Ornithinimicrobium cryptoxanthini TaxID=2934161 RepID=A0ABY4YNW7_9MICO|nr:ABC transporter permease [Ornithinimicrobium cryptoxanthini]USQ77832.1 ABC transporter permease [Ornithinimicrobium cryptoxanthini]